MKRNKLRQKYIYNCSFDGEEFPLIREDEPLHSPIIDYKETSFIFDSLTKARYIRSSVLHNLEEDDFDSLLEEMNQMKVSCLAILDDVPIISGNGILEDGYRCYLRAFLQKIQDAGFKSYIIGEHTSADNIW